MENMEKKFNEWNQCKKSLDVLANAPDCHEREIWWCSIGVNVGSEQLSQTSDFSRPVLVVRKFTRDIFWGIPLTTKTKDINFRMRFSYDRKRLVRKIAVMPKVDFANLITMVKDLL